MCKLAMLYVFVDIKIDVQHLVACIKKTFPAGTKLALACIIQFSSSLQVNDSQQVLYSLMGPIGSEEVAN